MTQEAAQKDATVVMEKLAEAVKAASELYTAADAAELYTTVLGGAEAADRASLKRRLDEIAWSMGKAALSIQKIADHTGVKLNTPVITFVSFCKPAPVVSSNARPLLTDVAGGINRAIEIIEDVVVALKRASLKQKQPDEYQLEWVTEALMRAVGELSNARIDVRALDEVSQE